MNQRAGESGRVFSPIHRLDDYFPEMALDHFLRFDHLTPSIIAATGTGPMQQLRIAAIRTLHHLGLSKATVVLAAPLAGARLRGRQVIEAEEVV